MLLWPVERRRRFWLGNCFEKRFCYCIGFFVISIRFLNFLKLNLALLFAEIMAVMIFDLKDDHND